jgi:beta-glucosidase
MRLSRVAGPLLCLFLLPRLAAAQSGGFLPYRDAARPIPERVQDLIARMTLDEKFWQLFMIPGDLDDSAHDYSRGIFGLQIPAIAGSARAHAERINGIQRFFVERTRLGIPIIPFDEALHGLTREGALIFPQAIGLAATWDTGLVARVAGAVARETRSRGIRQVLSPVVNIASDVRWGRVEETYGEDPYLSSRMGLVFIRAFESAGIVATPKHFVANVGDGGRDSYPIDHSERMLEETYFPPFRVAVQEAGARSVMTAYNSVDGAPATQSRWLLTEVLKKSWGFGGFVISDAAATGGATVLHHTEPNTPEAAQHAFEAGLDVVFQSSWPQHRPYLDAFRAGRIAGQVIDSAVARVLRVKFGLGLFEHPYANPDSAERWNGDASHRALAREAARASMVLLKNERGVLPLRRELRSVAVIGADAAEARLGGYSGPGIRKVSIRDGIRAKLGDGARVHYVAGPGRTSPEHTVIEAAHFGSAGLTGSYYDNNRLDGEPRIVRRDPRVDFGWTLNSPGRGIPFDWYSVRWTGALTVPPGGPRRIGVEGNDGFRLYLDGKLVIDNWKKQSYRALFAEAPLLPGRRYDLKLEFFESTGNARVKLVWNAESPPAWTAAIDSAVNAARRSDAAIVVAGIEEGEFRDRAFLKLPGHQEELILAVAATGKPVVVVLVGGSAITMSRWLDRVDGVVMAWYAGEEAGHAVADVLVGDANPAGRLPITFPIAEGQLPLSYRHKPTGRGDDYLDLTGQPLFPFGFGLSYTAFQYSALTIDPVTIAPDGSAVIRARVKNVGTVAGDEVVQLYLRDVLTSVSRPLIELAGFARIHLKPGEEREVTFPVAPEHLRLLDREMRWVVEPGTFRVMVGASSKDIRLRGELVVR